MLNIYTSLGIIFAIWISTIGAIWKLGKSADEIASPEAKSNVFEWVRSANPSTVIKNFSLTFEMAFDRIFGSIVSFTGFYKSTLLTLALSIISYLIWVVFFPFSYIVTSRFDTIQIAGNLLIGVIAFNVIPDYLSLIKSRFAIYLMKGLQSWYQVLLIWVMDIVVTIIIFFAWYLYTKHGTLPSQVDVWYAWHELTGGGISVLVFSNSVRTPPIVFLVTTFFTVVWGFLYFVSGMMIKFGQKSDSVWASMQYILRFNEKPFQSLAASAVIVLTILFTVVAFSLVLVSSMQKYVT